MVRIKVLLVLALALLILWKRKTLGYALIGMLAYALEALAAVPGRLFRKAEGEQAA